MGTVFIFGMAYWNKTITRNEAIMVNATYTSHKESFRLFKTGHTKGIYVSFSDYDNLYIDTVCVDDELRMELDALKKDTKVQMLIHPNADTILDVRTADKQILEFHEVMKELETDRKSFFILGVFCYFSAIVGLARILEDCKIVLWWKRRKKEKLREKRSDRAEAARTEEEKLKKMSRKQRKEYNQKMMKGN